VRDQHTSFIKSICCFGQDISDVLAKATDGLNEGGVLVTYCAKGQLRRDLVSLNFKVEKLPGPPGKREMTRALRDFN
ncbi:MAG: MnmC family methyltransferase, partial [Cytophagales bacterium]